MRKERKLLFAVLLALVLSAYLVSAYEFPISDLKTTANSVIQVVQDAFGPIFEFLLGASSFDQHFFARILLLILIYAIVYTVLRRIEIFRRNAAVIFIVSAIVAILGARYMTEVGYIEAALLPYGTLAIAITVFLPFAIYFWFVFDTVNGSTGRRIAWVVYGLVFIALWISRWKEVGNAGWVYVVGIILVIIALLFDGHIRRYFGMARQRRFVRGVNDAEIARLQAEFQNIARVESEHARRRRAAIFHRLRDLGAHTPEGFEG